VPDVPDVRWGVGGDDDELGHTHQQLGRVNSINDRLTVPYLQIATSAKRLMMVPMSVV
jgi:hypothetical protein